MQSKGTLLFSLLAMPVFGLAAAVCYQEPSCKCISGYCGQDSTWCYVQGDCDEAFQGWWGQKYQDCVETPCDQPVPACTVCSGDDWTLSYAILTDKLDENYRYTGCCQHGMIHCNIVTRKSTVIINGYHMSYGSDPTKEDGCFCALKDRGVCQAPTQSPTKSPTKRPTNRPTLRPTNYPVGLPTLRPTFRPTYYPVEIPTLRPTHYPVRYPTYEPTRYPVEYPTYEPTRYPVEYPTDEPTSDPALLGVEGSVSRDEYDCGVINFYDVSQCTDESYCESNNFGVLEWATYDGNSGEFKCSLCTAGLFKGPVSEVKTYPWLNWAMLLTMLVVLLVLSARQWRRGGKKSIIKNIKVYLFSNQERNCMKQFMSGLDLYNLMCFAGLLNGLKVLQSLCMGFGLTIVLQNDIIAKIFAVSCDFLFEHDCSGTSSSFTCTTKVISRSSQQTNLEGLMPSIPSAAEIFSVQLSYELVRFIVVAIVDATETKRDDMALFAIDILFTALIGGLAFVSIQALSNDTYQPASAFFEQYSTVYAIVIVFKWIILQPVAMSMKMVCLVFFDAGKDLVEQEIVSMYLDKESSKYDTEK